MQAAPRLCLPGSLFVGPQSLLTPQTAYPRDAQSLTGEWEMELRVLLRAHSHCSVLSELLCLAALLRLVAGAVSLCSRLTQR